MRHHSVVNAVTDDRHYHSTRFQQLKILSCFCFVFYTVFCDMPPIRRSSRRNQNNTRTAEVLQTDTSNNLNSDSNQVSNSNPENMFPKTKKLPITYPLLKEMCLRLSQGVFTPFTDALMGATVTLAFFWIFEMRRVHSQAGFFYYTQICRFSLDI